MSEKIKVLVINGWAFSNGIWDSLVLKLNYDFEFISWNGVKNVNDYFTLVDNKIKNMNRKVVILAWSLGTLVSIGLSEESKKRILKYIFISATSKFTREKEYRIGWSKGVVESMKKDISLNKDRVLKSFAKNMLSENEKNFYVEIEKHILDCEDKMALLKGLDFLKDTDKRNDLKDLNSEVLFIHGSDDKICNLDSAMYMYKETLCKKTLEIIGESGHIPFYTKTKEVCSIVENFLL